MKNETDDQQKKRRPRLVRLPGFIADQDVGAGDVIKRATRAIGIKPCTACEERARRLNQRLAFRGTRKPPDSE